MEFYFQQLLILVPTFQENISIAKAKTQIFHILKQNYTCLTYLFFYYF
jgi:hypothetical protein